MERSAIALEGLHALKHALRFGAQITEILTDDLEKAVLLADGIADDLRSVLVERARVVSRDELRERSTQPIPTRVLAYAQKPTWTLSDCLPVDDRPTILLDDPRNSKNLGAVVRVGAANGAAGVLVNGPADFYNPMAIRGAAGLQWAIPCWGSQSLMEELDNLRTQASFTFVGLDADGKKYHPQDFPYPTIFAFGSERSGLSTGVRSRCDEIVSLPMTPHVSSLNLATTVSAVVYLRTYAL